MKRSTSLRRRRSRLTSLRAGVSGGRLLLGESLAPSPASHGRGLSCYGEPRDEGVLGASDARFGVGDPFLDLFEVAEHGASALRIKTEEVALVDHVTRSAERDGRTRRRVEGSGET